MTVPEIPINKNGRFLTAAQNAWVSRTNCRQS